MDEDGLRERFHRRILDRVNFERGRVRPVFSFDAAASFDIWRKEHRAVRLQADITNLTDRLNVINFSGVFSGTALGSPRTVALRLEAEF